MKAHTARNRLASLAALLLSLTALAMPALAQAANRSVESIEHRPLPGNALELTIKLNAPAPKPLTFSVNHPARLAIDLPDTDIAMERRYDDINSGPVRAVATAEGNGRSRIVVELLRMVPYSVRTQGNEVIVTIGKSGMSTGGAAAVQAATEAAERGNSITHISFRRGERGEARIIVKMKNDHATVNLSNQGEQVVADFTNVSLPQHLAQRMDVLDFATPAKYVDVAQKAGHAQISITPSQGSLFEQTAYQVGNTFTIELQPLTAAQKAAKAKADKQYSGERISFNFQNVEVRTVLQIIAEVAKTNMVIDDSVRGNMALRLDNVPWDQALDIVLLSNGLVKRQQDNVIFVATAAAMAKQDAQRYKAEKAKITLAPLVSELIQVNYAKAENIAKILKPQGGNSSSKDGNSNSILSERGRVTVDPRTNSLLVVDTRAKLEDVSKLIKKLDIPVRQVLIESRIVIASDNFQRALGTRFGVSAVSRSGSTTVGVSGTAATAGTIAGVPPALSTGGGTGGTGGSTGNGVFNFNLPAAISNPGSIGLVVLGSDFLINLELQAMQASGQGEIISAPRIVTTDRKEASIKQGFEIPYVSSSGNNGTNVQFKEALLSLTVTPSITPDNAIIMDLHITKDEPDFTRSVNGNPSLNKRELINQVLVKDGETAVLGGVLETTVSTSVNKVPILGDIPILGRLFRNDSKVRNKGELLIFITPKILKNGAALSTAR